MGINDEAIVLILDVGKDALQKSIISSDTFLKKEKICCVKFLQKKMFAAKNDLVGLILMGTSETHNNSDEQEGYKHIEEALPLTHLDWQVVRALERNVVYNGAEADWLLALGVAMDMLKRGKQKKKFGYSKIVLFSTFSSRVNEKDAEDIIKDLKNTDTDLVVISDNITESTEDISGIFSQHDNKTEHQKLNEIIITKIINKTSGFLCNFEYALKRLTRYERKKSRPFYWNSTLEIGSEIKIQISAIIGIKDDTHFKWEVKGVTDNIQCSTEYFQEGLKVDISVEDLLKAYMVGSTPIAYDESLGVDRSSISKGLRCIAFTNKKYIRKEYFCGNGIYLVLPKKDQTVSKKMFSCLVEAMNCSNVVMIAYRVYANGYKPKLVALIPNFEREYPCLTMIEMFYAEQYFYWNFPRLCSKNTEPTQEQYDAIDKLIDSMDLMDVGDENNINCEAFPQTNLMNMSLQYIYESVTQRALNPRQPLSTLDGRLTDSLKMPPKIKEQSDEYIKKVKELFPLEHKQKITKKDVIRHLGDIPAESSENDQVVPTETGSSVRVIIEVGTITPAEDFLALSRRGENFNTISKQIQDVISDLIFKSLTDQNEKIIKALLAYREKSKLQAPWNFNDWIRELKKIVITRRKLDFWENIIVKEHLGLIPTSESDLVLSVTDEEADEFYTLNIAQDTGGTSNVQGESIDELFDEM